MTQEELFDLMIPPGTPRSIIIDLAKEYDVELVDRKVPLSYANMEGDIREVLAFRGKEDVLLKVQDELFARLKAFIGED
jgi:hypothetical protein